MENQIDALTNVLRTCGKALRKIAAAGAPSVDLLETASNQLETAIQSLERRHATLSFDGQHDGLLDGH